MAPVNDAQTRVYGGRTGDERAADRRAALVDAAFELVAEQGWRALRIDVVCRRAKLNKRYFYEAFTSIDPLVAAVTSKIADDVIAATLAALPGPEATQEEFVTVGVGVFVRHLSDDPRRARVLFGAVAADDAASGHRADAIRRVIATVATQGRHYHGVGREPFVDLVAAMLVGGTSQAMLDWLDGRLDYTREEFITALSALWLGIGETVATRVSA